MSRTRIRFLAGLALAATLLLAAPAAADDAADLDAVAADYIPDQDIASCAFTRARLEGARREAVRRNDGYGTFDRFIAEVDVEIGRHLSGFCAGVAQPPGSNPAADLQAVADDYRSDGKVTDCRFTTQQLVNALNQASTISDIDAYAPGFRDEIRRAIARNRSGACAKLLPGGGLKIVKIKPRGGPKREYVTIKNASRGKVRLKGLALRDRSGRRIRFPRKAALKRGKSLRVVSGCFKRRKRAFKRKSRLYACKRKQLWNDKGDVVKLVNARGKVIAQRGYGRYKAVPRF